MNRLIYSDKDGKKFYDLQPDDDITIGRTDDNAICFHGNKKISRHHCSIYYFAERKCFVLKDLQSTNGTVLNGNKISSDVILTDKDQIRLGDVTLYYYCEEESVTGSSLFAKIAKPVQTFGLDSLNSKSSTQSFPKYNAQELRVQFSKPKKFKLSQGDEIGGFIVNEKIGESSHASVFSVVRKEDDQNVALKIYHKNFKNDSEVQQGFLNTMLRMSSLKSNSFIQYYDAGLHNGFCFYTMQFLGLGNLEEDIAISAPFKEVEALEHCLNIAGALNEALTKYDLIHRDLKSANVFFDIDNNVVISDIGLSDWECEAITGGYSVASPWYISPEQITGENIAWHSDLYSLGVILFQMLTGEFPFSSRVEDEMLRMHLEEPFPKPSQRNPNINVSKETISILEKMTAKDPARRYKNWEEFIKVIMDTIERLWKTSQEVNPFVPQRSEKSKGKVKTSGKTGDKKVKKNKLVLKGKKKS